MVSCPVYYTAEQRKLLHQALQISGLNPLALPVPFLVPFQSPL